MKPLRYALLALGGAAILVLSYVELPYYALGPGPVREVTALIRFDGPQRYESSGALVMTTVRSYRVTPGRVLVSWFDDEERLVPEALLYPPGLDRDQERRRSISDMDQSKIDASFLVLSRLTDYPKEHGRGAIIEGTLSSCPAEGKLFPGDLVTAIDDRPIDSKIEASRAIAAAPPGEALTFHVEVANERHEVEVTPEPCVESRPRQTFVGVGMVDAFPFPLTIESGDVGGPSAGLMWALGLYDLLTPEDLTGGRTVAGTGTIALDGTVGPIGGITEKVVAANRSGADMFLAPADDLPELEGVDTGDLRIVPVATFDEALEALGVPAESATAPVGA